MRGRRVGARHCPGPGPRGRGCCWPWWRSWRRSGWPRRAGIAGAGRRRRLAADRRSWCSTRTRPPRRPCRRCLTWARRWPDGSPRHGRTDRSPRCRMSRPACAGSDRQHWPRYRLIFGLMRNRRPGPVFLRRRSRSRMPVPAGLHRRDGRAGSRPGPGRGSRKPRRLHWPRRPTPRRHRDPVASTGRPRLKPRPPITWRRLEPWPKNAHANARARKLIGARRMTNRARCSPRGSTTSARSRA